jgi:hypothetical protein
MITDQDRQRAREIALNFGGNGLSTDAQVELVARKIAELRAKAIASGIEAIVCDDITRRQAHGIAKYGQTIADNPLPLRGWLQHAYEETLDKAVYLRRAIAEIDARNGERTTP